MRSLIPYFSFIVMAASISSCLEDPTSPDESEAKKVNTDLASRIQGTWYDSDQQLWVFADDNSITYAYPDEGCYNRRTYDYSLSGDTLKGEEWEWIDSDPAYPRVTVVYFEGEKLVVDITNDVPEGHENGPREISHLAPFGNNFPPSGWPSQNCSENSNQNPVPAIPQATVAH